MADKNIGFSLEAMKQVAVDLRKATKQNVDIEVKTSVGIHQEKKLQVIRAIIGHNNEKEPDSFFPTSFYSATWEGFLVQADRLKGIIEMREKTNRDWKSKETD